MYNQKLVEIAYPKLDKSLWKVGINLKNKGKNTPTPPRFWKMVKKISNCQKMIPRHLDHNTL